jgi:hypothetical protein
MAYTLTIYTHRSTGRDRPAAERIADMIFGKEWEAPPDPATDGEEPPVEPAA